jgi:glycosyltransferase involved in cell wall biosynthesis
MRGGQRQVLLLMEALRKAHHECALLARRGRPLWQAAKAAGFEIHPAGLMNIWRYSIEADIVHVHDAHSHTLAAIASRRRFVVSRRVGFAVGRSPLSQWKYARGRRYLAVSHFVADQLSRGGIPEDWIDVIYDAVRAEGTSDEWSPHYPAVGLASADPQKGRDLLTQAASLARIQLVLSDKIADDLRQASMFVYITRSEGLGSAALLAMTMGVPVIASRVGGLPEVVDDDISGLLVENDAGEIAAAMQRIIQNPELARSFIKNAKAKIAARFTPNHLAAATLTAYRRALAH